MPIRPWKNTAAIGGALMISIVRIAPMPPCCIAMLVRLSVLLGNHTLGSQNAMPTAITMSNAKVTMTVKNAIEKMVPMP